MESRRTGMRPHELRGLKSKGGEEPTAPSAPVAASEDARAKVHAEVKDVLEQSHKAREHGASVEFK